MSRIVQGMQNTTSSELTIALDRRPDVDTYLQDIRSEGERFASIAEAGPFDVPIDACPGWDMRELVIHVGLVHLWAATNIVFPSERWLSVDDFSDLQRYWPDYASERPGDERLISWYRSTVANLVDVIEAMPEDHECLTFLPAPSPLVMWARRQASEIAVHRCDAEVARGVVPHVEPDFASDMLDELVCGFATRMRAGRLDRDRVLHVSADDVGDDYLITLSPSGLTVAADAGPADLRVSGSVADLYLLLWNRDAGPTVVFDGDATVLDDWSEACRIEWI